MKVSVHESVRQVGTPFPFSAEESVPPFLFGGREISFGSPCSCTGTVTCDGKGFTTDAVGNAVFRSVCDRCCEPFERAFSFSVNERFVRSEEEECYLYSGDELDLSEAFMDNLLLAMPIVNLCSNGCRGLCPTCGANLNLGECSCGSKTHNSAFDILQSLSFENKEV